MTEVITPTPRAVPLRRRVGLGLIMIALLLVGIWLGAVLTDDDTQAAGPRTPTTLGTTAAPFSPDPSPGLADEPVAAVAAAVGPSVVQLETPGGLGSGVVYDARGLILTAAHVVESFDTVTVRLSDGRSMEGTVVGTHDVTDIAVVSVDATDLPVATLALGEDLRVGQLAIALGSPFGFDQTVTSGIVSSVNRIVRGVPMVQTDAAINPGNSGGPLLDRDGRVIGINDVIFTQTGGSDGVGFAIAIDIASAVADQLVAGGDVQLAFLGVSTTQAMTGEAGAVVQEVVPGSAAASAGVQVGDRIVAVDGRPIADSADLRAEIVRKRPGDRVALETVRGGATLDLQATLGSTPD